MKASYIFTKQDFKKIYDQHFESLRNFLYYKCGNIDLAEDLVQEVFIKVWEKRNSIKKETVKNLLSTMAANLLINHFKHQQVVANHAGNTKRYNMTEYNSPEFVLEEKEFEKKFNDVINALPEGCREVFLMNRIEKLKYDEIAARIGMSVKTIEKRMSKAIGTIKKELGVNV